MCLQIGIDIDHFPGIKDDVDFTEKLVKEQSVFCLPAKVKSLYSFILVFFAVTNVISNMSAHHKISFFLSSAFSFQTFFG